MAKQAARVGHLALAIGRSWSNGLTASAGTCLTWLSAAVSLMTGSAPNTPRERGLPEGGSAHNCSDFSGPSWKAPTRLSVNVL